MRKVILFFLWISLCYGQPFLQKLPDPAELEVRIIEKIFKDLTKRESVRIYILGDGKEEVKDKIEKYSEFLKIADVCSKADIVLLTGKARMPRACKDKISFALGRDLLFKLDSCVGAFYWKKGRPNILFLKERLRERMIKLPPEYGKYIESLRGVNAPVRERRT